MKKVLVERYELTEEDIGLFNNILKRPPENPCIKCSLRGDSGCCGCESRYKYDDIRKKYQDAGMGEVFDAWMCSLECDKEIEELASKMKELITAKEQATDKLDVIFKDYPNLLLSIGHRLWKMKKHEELHSMASMICHKMEE